MPRVGDVLVVANDDDDESAGRTQVRVLRYDGPRARNSAGGKYTVAIVDRADPEYLTSYLLEYEERDDGTYVPEPRSEWIRATPDGQPLALSMSRITARWSLFYTRDVLTETRDGTLVQAHMTVVGERPNALQPWLVRLAARGVPIRHYWASQNARTNDTNVRAWTLASPADVRRYAQEPRGREWRVFSASSSRS